MSEDRYRSIGSILGLAIGILVMLALGFGGVLAGAVFGAGGCVAGAITAERLYRWNRNRGA